MPTKIVTTKLRPAKTAKHSVREKRVRKPNGEYVVVHKLDANSSTFTDDLTYVFEKNVARARRQNKKLLGTADFGRRTS